MIPRSGERTEGSRLWQSSSFNWQAHAFRSELYNLRTPLNPIRQANGSFQKSK
jgi:hypothetical protein